MRSSRRCPRQHAAGRELAAPLAEVGEAQDRVDDLVVGRELERVDAGLAERRPQRLLPPLGGGGEAAPEEPVVRVDEELLAGLGVLDHHHARDPAAPSRADRSSRTATISCRCASRASASVQPGALMKSDTTKTSERRGIIWKPVCSSSLEVRRAGVALDRPREHLVEQVEHVPTAAPRLDDRIDAVAVEERAHAVAVAGEQAREHGDEIGRHRALAHVLRAEVDRRAEVQEEPRGDLAVLVVLADVGRLQARGDVPVDVPDVVVILVLAQVREVEAEAAEQRPVVAVQEPVETADHRPLEPLQDQLGIGAARRRRGARRAAGGRRVSRPRRPGHASPAASPAPARAASRAG